MTEMEQLKKNTQEQFAMERFTAVFEWMGEVELKWDKEMIVAKRNLNLSLLVIAVQLILSFVINSPLWILCFFLWFILAMRQEKITQRIEYCKGQLMGANKMLFLLGMSSTDIEDELNKRKTKKKSIGVSPFKRFKEFFERIGVKNKKEAHA